MNEESKYDKYDKEKKKFAKADTRMKFGKFYGKAKEARDRLRPGEVKRYDKKLGKYVSNKDWPYIEYNLLKTSCLHFYYH